MNKEKTYKVSFFGWNVKECMAENQTRLFQGKLKDCKEWAKEMKEKNAFFGLSTGGAMIFSESGKLLKFLY